MLRTVVLNNDNQPLGVVSVRRALTHVLSQRAEVLETIPEVSYTSAGLEHPLPRVIRFRTSVIVPSADQLLPWTRRGVLERDNYRCGYCGLYGNTIDHIIPKSRYKGNPNQWDNTCACCSSCNGAKGARTPEEAGMPLLITPRPVSAVDVLRADIRSTGTDLQLLAGVA